MSPTKVFSNVTQNRESSNVYIQLPQKTHYLFFSSHPVELGVIFKNIYGKIMAKEYTFGKHVGLFYDFTAGS